MPKTDNLPYLPPGLAANEIWKNFKGAEDDYQISNYGRVRSKDRIDRRGGHRKGKMLAQNIVTGHKIVTLTLENKQSQVRVASAVLDHFVAPKPSVAAHVIFLDDDPMNVHASNLRWRIDVVKQKEAEDAKKPVDKMAVQRAKLEQRNIQRSRLTAVVQNYQSEVDRIVTQDEYPDPVQWGVLRTLRQVVQDLQKLIGGILL